jgi:hypothetical protein
MLRRARYPPFGQSHPVPSLTACCALPYRRYPPGMAHELKEIEVAGTRTIATFDSTYTIMAVCNCGHTRELHTLSLRRCLGAGVTINGVRAKLRCHKCDAMKPAIKIYRAVMSSIDVRP